tara:strand:+ start:68 stop:772 length:705 start_codon:yes stop_codon:yes gene_type:complete
MTSYKGKRSRALFFGREKCESSAIILRKLKKDGFNVTYVESKVRGETLPKDILCWKGEYILCFRSLFILPEILLDRATIAAINFHPAPPEYPGSGCVNFALYENATEYGVTAHIMNEKVDNGEILEVRRFPIFAKDNLSSILSRTHCELLNLCSDFISELSSDGVQVIREKKLVSKHERWNGTARSMKDLDALQIISPDVSVSELKRIIRATYIEGFPPKIKIHNYQFYLHLDD